MLYKKLMLPVDAARARLVLWSTCPQVEVISLCSIGCNATTQRLQRHVWKSDAVIRFCKIGCNAKTATTCLENQENAEVGSPLNEPLSDPRCTRHNAEKVCKQSSCHQAFGIRLTSSRLDNKVKSGTSFNLRTPAQVWAFCCVMSCEALYCATTLFNTSQSTREDTCSEGVPAEPR